MKISAKKFCPYCERVEIALKLRKLSSEHIHLEYPEGGQFPDNLCQINPQKTFPTLQITSNFGFAESLVILEYLDSIHSAGPKIYGNSAENSAKIKFNIEILEKRVTHFLRKCIYTFESIIEETKAIENMPQVFNQLSSLLEINEKRFFGGVELNAEDIQIAPFIMRYLAAHSINSKIPLPDPHSKAGHYFNDISHHSIIRKCIPHVEELAIYIANYNSKHGLNTSEIKNASRTLVQNPFDYLNILNSTASNIKWTIEHNSNGNFILGKFKFNNNEKSLQALHLLNEIQESVNHHTSFVFENFNSLKVEICTHKPNYGVTQIDFSFANFLTNKIQPFLS